MTGNGKMLDGYGLGATLYMPVIHERVPDIVTGRSPRPSGSVVLCLEDALHERDVERGVETLTDLLASADSAKNGPRIFVRPRSYDMAVRLAALPGIHRVDGFVAPKMRVETAPDWMSLAREADIGLMPTLETPDFFDPGRMIAIRDVLNAEGRDHVRAIRLGGNDFLGALGLRRRRGMTAYEGPLSWVLSMASGLLVSAGFPVAAPVYDVIDDLDTLEREIARDVEMGFVSKTAIHPAQVPVIEHGLSAEARDIEAASAILDRDARAVFQVGGVMCEPATHHLWARRVLARRDHFGVRAETEALREAG